MKIKDKIERIKVVDLNFFPDNPRKHSAEQIENISKQITDVGFNQPIIIDENNTVLVGNGRLEAADKLNMLELPCIRYTDLTDAQKKQLVVADNKLNDDSSWDNEKLNQFLNELNENDLDSFFSTEEQTEVFEEFADDAETKEDDFELPKEPKYKIKRGEIYQLGNHRLMCGDATNKDDVSNLMDGKYAVLMVTDPPYGVNYNPQWRDDADKAGILGNRYPTRSLGKVTNDDRADWFEAWELFSGDVAYVYHAGLFSNIVADSLVRADFELKSQIIWVKPHFALSRGDYHWKHEPIWYAVKKGKRHNWQGSRTMHTVWEIAGMNAMGASHAKEDETTGHGTQKPIKCMAIPIENSSALNEGVYDPFGGSGSTLIACEQLNRKCFMMELGEHYCSVIIERWEKLTDQKAIKVN